MNLEAWVSHFTPDMTGKSL